MFEVEEPALDVCNAEIRSLDVLRGVLLLCILGDATDEIGERPQGRPGPGRRQVGYSVGFAWCDTEVGQKFGGGGVGGILRYEPTCDGGGENGPDRSGYSR